jgi:RNA polymerase sigma factor (sigma-70 family)
MALTRDFKETVFARAQSDVKFRQALFTEAINAYLAGDTSTGKAMLRDLVNAWPEDACLHAGLSRAYAELGAIKLARSHLRIVRLQRQVTHQTSSELKQNLLSAINQLNPTQKSLVLLKDYEGYSYQEIGEIMNLSESQVKVYLHRARLFLKTKLLELEKVNA